MRAIANIQPPASSLHPALVCRRGKTALTPKTYSIFINSTLDGRSFAINAQIMSSLRTMILAGVAWTWTSPAFALDHVHYVFAECVGRFSAEMEHAWLLSDPEADALQVRRSTFIALMEASMPTQKAREVLAYRLDNKIAHASLLTIASFGRDPDHAQRAREKARFYRVSCEQLLLDS